MRPEVRPDTPGDTNWKYTSIENPGREERELREGGILVAGPSAINIQFFVGGNGGFPGSLRSQRPLDHVRTRPSQGYSDRERTGVSGGPCIHRTVQSILSCNRARREHEYKGKRNRSRSSEPHVTTKP